MVRDEIRWYPILMGAVVGSGLQFVVGYIFKVLMHFKSLGIQLSASDMVSRHYVYAF